MYLYDRGGNMTSYSEYAYTTGTLDTAAQTVGYIYGDTNWKDKVTAIGGKAITYDAIGNPLTYDGWTFTWKAGRMLASMVKTGTNAQFTYDHNSLRVKRVVNGVTTNYTLNGKNIVHMTQGSNDLHFFYDAQNKPAIVRFNGTDYFYVYNLQGDVVAMIDANGTQVVEYYYDAWGAPISKTGTMAATLGTVNPFRYRGYVYDEETGLYYLRSRYYNPVWKRFIFADSIYHNNLFIYCVNSPVAKNDTDGKAAGNALYSTMAVNDGGSSKQNPYPTYGVSKEIASAIDIILSDSQKWAYSKKVAGAFKYGIYKDKKTTRVCCAYLMVGLMGGSKGVKGRRANCQNLCKLTSLDQLEPGMEIFQGTKHCGLVVMYDFGSGPELGVFQSTVVSNLEQNSKTIEAAVFMNDANAGPNITALRSVGSWTDFGTPGIDTSAAFFFEPKSQWYLFGE